jgi:parallel beta-helix repeat protein
MIHRKVLFLLLTVICLSLLGSVLFGAKASPTIIRVPQDYSTIQEAINQANPGDTVSVSAGTYYESLTIDKNLALIGENRETTILNGMGGSYGIGATSVNVTITGFKILNATTGIYIEQSNGSMISHNDITAGQRGIWLHYSNSSTVSDNVVHDVAWRGIVLCGGSSENTITLNTVTNCGYGIVLSGEGDFIFHNNFVNNQNQTDFIPSFYNAWNDTYEGNYWSNYNGTDADHDGIGDTPYLIDGNNQDNHPLMGTFSQFKIQWQGETYTLTIICNSTITNFDFGTTHENTISFNVTGPEGTTGFCRIVIPYALLGDNSTILIDGLPPIMEKELLLSNSTHTYLYFTYTLTTHEVIIVPEFSTTMILALFIIVSLSTARLTRKVNCKEKQRQR